MQEFQTGAVRDTGGKGRMDLIPWCAIRRVSRHMEDAIRPDPTTGKPHYPERDWEKGMPMHCMIDSAFRHLAKYVEGMDDEDHLCAAATNLLMALWTEENRPNMQDIPTRLSLGSSLRPLNVNGQGVVLCKTVKETPQKAAGREETLDEYAQDLLGAKLREKPMNGQMTIDDLFCDCYNPSNCTCLGTKERDACNCGGVKSKCDFYDKS